MKVQPLSLPDVLVIEPDVFRDERGFFFESFNKNRFFDLTGLAPEFVQDNHSRSTSGALHGIHYQIQNPQAKLVRVIAGQVFDVVVDIRKSSPAFGHWAGAVLSAENKHQMWVPQGFAHGFLVISEFAELLYKTTDYWAPVHERYIAWNDPAIGIDWPIDGQPILSTKDRLGVLLGEADIFL